MTPLALLKEYWGHDAFRPIQEEIITSVLSGKDILALLPTGGGKSVCFQIPAMLRDGLCIVISPLIALMKDQVENLKRKNIPALAIHSGMTFYEVNLALQNAIHGNYKFLYVSPERLETKLFKDYLPALSINFIAVDEAHCISQWGYDFRPPYLRIAHLRTHFPKASVIALTASATPLVQDDICKKLLFKEPNIFRQSFEKPNVSFSVLLVESKINKLIDILQKVPGTAIVYCRNRKRCKETAHLLRLNHISADYYHAGLPQDERSKKQEAWIQNKTRVIVCTNAFGMGIDKPDVRLVIHLDIPDNLENYYQESGRAGRDGLRAFAVLLYSGREIVELEKMPEIKYPEVKEIRIIYQALANHLQIPVGSGEGMYYDFNIHDFIRNFKLDLLTAINGLKALEQDGHLTFNEQVFLPAKLGFTCNKESLESFEASHPLLENLIKYLLRTYEGIFDNIVSINEALIGRLTKLPADVLVQQLQQLRAFGIIEYNPQKETPQVYFVHNRAPTEYLAFDHVSYLGRKKQYILRLQVMLRYLHLKAECRSEYIGNYFGDKEIKRCNVCDNCLNQKNTRLTAEEFKLIQSRIAQFIPEEGIEIKPLLLQLTGLKKEKIWTVLDYLQAEKKLLINDAGVIFKRC